MSRYLFIKRMIILVFLYYRMELKSIEIFHLGRDTTLNDSSRLITIHFQKFLKGEDRNKIFSKATLEALHKFNRVRGWAQRFSSRLIDPFVSNVRVFSSFEISLSKFLFTDHLPHICERIKLVILKSFEKDCK